MVISEQEKYRMGIIYNISEIQDTDIVNLLILGQNKLKILNVSEYKHEHTIAIRTGTRIFKTSRTVANWS